jgi:hypothetical protein
LDFDNRGIFTYLQTFFTGGLARFQLVIEYANLRAFNTKGNIAWSRLLFMPHAAGAVKSGTAVRATALGHFMLRKRLTHRRFRFRGL